MPQELHDRLQREARKKIRSKGEYGSVDERRNAYVYGGMRKSGWKPGPPASRPQEGQPS